jgi:hypothetical protein
MRSAIAFITFALSISTLAVEMHRDEKSNLVPNGTFDKNPSRLVDWEPLPRDGSIECLDFNPDRGRIIVFTLSEKIAYGTGLLFYSGFIPIEEGKKYKFSVDYKSFGPKPKPFVKGYALFPDVHGKTERREIYKKQIFEKEISSDWKTITMEFTPQNPIYKGKYEIKWVKVLLYAYLKPGQIYFDNVCIEEVK